ncbi:MAG: cation-translocating P-type ATPase [Anaerolineales bacterium]|nr:cation-translocating P-type ATPase [Anaerolineales bacterium]
MAEKTKESLDHQKHSDDIHWHAMAMDDVLVKLEAPTHGLTDEEVRQRTERYGLNELKEKPRPTFWQLVLAQLNNFIVILLIVASLISAVLGDWIEAAVIMLIVVLNAILGVVQESRAEEALAALKKMAAPECQVLRNGQRVSVPARELVPGDVVFLEAGNFVPADMRLIEAVNLRVEEAALTGESVPVQKNAALLLDREATLGDRKNTVFMGTLVNYGRGRGIVVATGMTTQLGMIADMLQAVEDEGTPLQQRLDQLGKSLAIAALAICGVVFLLSAMRSGIFTEGFTPEVRGSLLESFMIAVGLAIAAVPEGLAAVVTISLALGMREMVRRHALIRRLASVETLGSATVICSDKTGTLTQNVMTVTRMWVEGKFAEISGTGYDPEGKFFIDDQEVDLAEYPGLTTVLWVGVLNNDAVLEPVDNEGVNTYRMIGDPTEGAMLVAAAKAWERLDELTAAYPRQKEIPFDSALKRMTTVHKITWIKDEGPSPFHDETHLDKHAITVKGAPDLVLELCTDYQTLEDKVLPLTDEIRSQIRAANDRMTNDALRVMGFAYRVEEDIPDELSREFAEQGLIFAGMMGMIDPARPEVKPALEKARRAGLRTIMITGDYPNTGRAVAESIGLLRPGDRVHTGTELNGMSEQTLQEEVKATAVFARVSPEHKMRIVDALRANNEVVAMTGDGVNDAPAIKRADIGVSMGITGTDVAKQTADMVLTDDNYVSIVAAVEQGRIIYSNIRKFVFFLLSSNIAEIMIIFLATLAGLPMPLTVIQLLWLNLLTDGAPALALAMEKGDPDIMERPPRPKSESIVNGPMRLGMFIQTIAQTGAVLGAFALGLLWHLEEGAMIPAGISPIVYLLQHDWRGVDVQTAETMAFVTLSLCELFRAYTVRSERSSIFRLGIFSNKYMQMAVGLSIALLLLVVNVPFLQPIFNTHFLSAREWAWVLGLAIFPAIAEEFTKLYLRRSGR